MDKTRQNIVRSFDKEDFLEDSRIMSCFVQSESVLFNLLRVPDHPTECYNTWQITDFRTSLFLNLAPIQLGNNELLVNYTAYFRMRNAISFVISTRLSRLPHAKPII